MSRLGRFRERLVLGPIRRRLAPDERILAWSHARLPDVKAPGVLVVTTRAAVLHVARHDDVDVRCALTDLERFELDRRDPEVVRVRLCRDEGDVHVELSLTDRKRSRSVGRVLSELYRHRIAAPHGFDPRATSPLPPLERRAKHHARRVWVTVVGVAVLLLSALFATPIVPGPGALTAVAGIAILAREYEWARDLHVWASRAADRFLQWVQRQSHRLRRRAARRVPLEAELPATATTTQSDGHGADSVERDASQASRG